MHFSLRHLARRNPTRADRGDLLPSVSQSVSLDPPSGPSGGLDGHSDGWIKFEMKIISTKQNRSQLRCSIELSKGRGFYEDQLAANGLMSPDPLLGFKF